MAEQNYLVMRKGIEMTKPNTLEEANKSLERLSVIYGKDTMSVVPTDKAMDKEGITLTVAPEEVEDTGCAGGACTL